MPDTLDPGCCPETGDPTGSYCQSENLRPTAFRRREERMNGPAVARWPSPDGAAPIEARVALGGARFQRRTLECARGTV
jgi:hypothetical protein